MSHRKSFSDKSVNSTTSPLNKSPLDIVHYLPLMWGATPPPHRQYFWYEGKCPAENYQGGDAQKGFVQGGGRCPGRDPYAKSIICGTRIITPNNYFLTQDSSQKVIQRSKAKSIIQPKKALYDPYFSPCCTYLVYTVAHNRPFKCMLNACL